MILKISSFSIIKEYQLQITFNSGEVRIVDLKNELNGEVFEPLKDLNFFKRAFLTEWHVIQWPNGADFAPEYLYQISKEKVA